ncbi:MAG TPA: hypothetical protein VKU01_32175 [Bryobacteraceae bacterium]|nr:hypothetical protein [Bryobacteraceae bacterium]
MKRLLNLTAVGLLAFCLYAQDTPKQETKAAGQDAKNAARNAGKASKHAGKAVTTSAKKGVHKAAVKTENGADKVRQKTKQQ